MTAEGTRSMDRIRIAGFEPPYYVGYELKDRREERVGGRYDALYEDSSKHTRKLYADVRVGSYDLDSSSRDDRGFILGPQSDSYDAPRDGPIEDRPQALRNTLWLLTDEKYKDALASFFRLKSKRVYREDEPGRAPPFSREIAQHHVDEPLPFAFDRERWPAEVRRSVNPFAHSNGHARSQGSRAPLARMGNLFVTSTHRLPMTALERMLIEKARRQGKPYGLIIRDVAGGDTSTATYGYQAFEGTPRLAYRVGVNTSEEELVRGVELVGTPLGSVSKVVATGEEERVFNGFCGAESGYLPVSTIAPAALVSEMEFERVPRAKERGPILPAPWERPREP